MTDTTVKHWHVATGLTGYGPEGSDEYGTATDLPGVASLVAEECTRAADSQEQAASSIAESGDYEAAWKTRERADALAILAHNFDNGRAEAPLYAGKPDLWAGTITRQVAETFPLDIGDHSRLYVWECGEAACEHLADHLADD